MSRRTPTIHLSARMKEQAAKYAHRYAGVTMADAVEMAKLGLLTVDGRPKFKGGPAPKSGERRKRLDLLDDEIAQLRRRDPSARDLGLGKDEMGYYITDGRRRSASYATIAKIPVAVIRDMGA